MKDITQQNNEHYPVTNRRGRDESQGQKNRAPGQISPAGITAARQRGCAAGISVGFYIVNIVEDYRALERKKNCRESKRTGQEINRFVKGMITDEDAEGGGKEIMQSDERPRTIEPETDHFNHLGPSF